MGCDTFEWSEESRANFTKPETSEFETKLAELEKRYQDLVAKGKFTPKPLGAKLLWVGVDLDGTLAEPLWTPDNPTSEIGDPIPESIEKINELIAHGYKIIVHTSRPWTDYQVIEQWLRHYNIPYKEIQCGKPLYAAYIDDRAIHAEEPSWLPKS